MADADTPPNGSPCWVCGRTLAGAWAFGTFPPSSLAALEAWNRRYEERHMVYAASNVTIAEATMALFLSLVPACLHGLGRRVAYCLMDARLRQAVGYPDPAPLLRSALMTTLWLRQTVIRHLCLPRPQWRSARRTPFTTAAATHNPDRCCQSEFFPYFGENRFFFWSSDSNCQKSNRMFFG